MARFRLTGISLWGAQWEHKDDDKEVARRALNLLGDRRMLWKDFSLEIEEDCVRSADYARRELGELLNNPEISDGLSAQLKALQASFRGFMDEVGHEDHPRHRWSHGGTDALSMALGKLRALVGIHIAELATQFDLEVPDDLARIVPDQTGWFFERFS